MRVDVDFGDHQPSTVSVELRKDRVKDVCPEGNSPQALACTNLPGGERLYQESLPGDALPHSYRILVQRKDGSTVELTVYSGQLHAAAGDQPPTRQAPPQTSKFWGDIAKSPLWGLRIPVDTARDGANRASPIQE
jgi:hypothetical protein